jgi:hypothetical protein
LKVTSPALSQAFSSCPLKIDIPTSTVELVTNRRRDGRTSDSTGSSARKIRQRNIFIFDELLAGVGASGRARELCSQRLRRCLLTGRNFTCLATGCGLGVAQEEEIPVKLLLGGLISDGSSDSGIIPTLLDDLFKVLHPAKYDCERQKCEGADPVGYRHNSSSASAKEHHSALKAKLQREKANASVIVSAFILKNNEILDLLNGQSQGIIDCITRCGSTSGETLGKDTAAEWKNPQQCYMEIKSTGSASIRKGIRVRIDCVADFQRIAGVILGRRAGVRDFIVPTRGSIRDQVHANILMRCSVRTRQALMATAEGAWLSPDITIDTSRQHTSRRCKGVHNTEAVHDSSAVGTSSNDNNVVAGCGSGVMLFQFNISYTANAGLSTKRQEIRVSFLCPCGPNWSRPGKLYIVRYRRITHSF